MMEFLSTSVGILLVAIISFVVGVACAEEANEGKDDHE